MHAKKGGQASLFWLRCAVDQNCTLAVSQRVRPGKVVPDTDWPPWKYWLTQVGVPFTLTCVNLRKSLLNRLKMLAFRLTFFETL